MDIQRVASKGSIRQQDDPISEVAKDGENFDEVNEMVPNLTISYSVKATGYQHEDYVHDCNPSGHTFSQF